MKAPTLIVKIVAQDSEKTFHCMLCWKYESGRLEHVANLTVDRIKGGCGVAIARTSTGIVFIPSSVYEILKIKETNANWQISMLQSTIEEFFSSWMNEIEFQLNTGDQASLDLIDGEK